MPQPTKYNPSFSFTDAERRNPTQPLPGTSVDVELGNIKRTTDETITNIGLIQRDDGKLRNQVVTLEALGTDVLTSLRDWRFRGPWVTGTEYAVSDVVEFQGATYVCGTAHTAATAFETDAANWYLFANPLISRTSTVFAAHSGDGMTNKFSTPGAVTNSTQVYVYVDGEIIDPNEITANGSTITLLNSPPVGSRNVLIFGVDSAVSSAVQSAEDARTRAETAATNAENTVTTAVERLETANAASIMAVENRVTAAGEMSVSDAETRIQAAADTAFTAAQNKLQSGSQTAADNAAAAVRTELTNAVQASAAAANNSATAAAESATDSENFAMQSGNSATTSEARANDAAASATAAANSATAAESSADTAGTRATAAANSATAASASATAAETARSGAEAALTAFRNVYLGAHSTPPTVDNSGGALDIGDLYLDSERGVVMVRVSNAP